MDDRAAEGEAPPRPGRGVNAADEADRLEGDTGGGHVDTECGDPGRGGRGEEDAVQADTPPATAWSTTAARPVIVVTVSHYRIDRTTACGRTGKQLQQSL